MIAAIIQARMNSTRLPGKVMKPLLGQPVLYQVFMRIADSEYLEEIIIATTTDSSDDCIEEFCKKENLPVFRGSENDVLDRYYQCALHCNVDTIVRITADCPLHDATIIDAAIKEYLEGGYDYVTNTLKYTYPDGMDVEVFSFKVLERAWKNARLVSEREHVTPYIRTDPRTRSKNIISKKVYPQYRLTLDTPEDYLFITLIFEGMNRYCFSLDETIIYLKKNPELLTINQHIGMNEGYFKSLIQDAKKCILTTDRILLRELTLSDATVQYCRWLNDPEVTRFLETKGSTILGIQTFIAEKNNRPDCILWGIFLKETNQHIGNIKLEPITFTTKEAEMGIMIGERSVWGKGYCQESVRLVTDYAFSTMGLTKIKLGVIVDNSNAINCYKKSGFIIERIVPYAGINQDVYKNNFSMSITKGESQ
jgi:spore coat polysaccharide biosynthesis protein SpsF (cytidylyltransferase family)